MRTLTAFLVLLAPFQDNLEKRRDALAPKLEEIRGLAFKAPLGIREGTRKEYAAFTLECARKVYGDLAAIEKGLKALDLIPSKMRLDLAFSATAAFAPKAFFRENEVILLDRQAEDDWLVNKMALGLIDQRYAPAVPATYDAQMAYAALRMGDAEVVKNLFCHAGRLPEKFLEQLTRGAAEWEEGESKLAGAVVPRFFVRTGDFSWRRGAVFAATLFARGGFASLDKAYAAPPASTEQVIHPEKYIRGEKPVEIDVAPVAAFLSDRKYKAIGKTALGELGAAMVLETRFPKSDLRAASEGWGGDTFAIYEKEGAPALVLWATEWDTEQDAAEFQEQAVKISAPVIRHKTSVALGVNVPREMQDDFLKSVWKCPLKGGKTGVYGE